MERTGDHFKGTGLALLRPDMIRTMWWDLIGGLLGSDGVPYVYWNVVPVFYYHWDDDAGPGCRTLVCGSEYTVA